ncbi:hypothetical protein GGS20DRAFT_552721 [Poronia punctata]|nr:hypothetical protein GGS20DRAFT_552721 [Poronia punctata]
MAEQQPLTDLANVYRELYRSKVRVGIDTDTTIPFVLPFHLLTYLVVPTLYLAIPHKDRPWLYRARWLILAFNLSLNWYIIRNTVSLNFASSYGTGLLTAWGTIWNLTLLVWTRPQWDAKRVERRRKRSGRVDGTLVESSTNGHAHISNDATFNAADSKQNGNSNGNGTGIEEPHDGLRRRNLHFQQSAESDPLPDDIGTTAEEKLLMREIIVLNKHDGNPPLSKNTLVELCRLTLEQEYEYYWQEYPSNASFWTRFDWAFDIVSSLRLTGWNWAPSCLPPYKPPPRIGPYQLPLEFGPQKSKRGFERTLSRRWLIYSRWLKMIPSYIVVDLCATLMTTDPYFVAGPGYDHLLPDESFAARLHPAILSIQRAVIAFVGIIAALHLYWDFGALFLTICCPGLLGFRAHPWHLPTMTGSFTQVLDHGLAGFWGAWWHQTFRVGFSAPTKWLIRNGYLPSSSPSSSRGNDHHQRAAKNSQVGLIVGTCIAFAHSSFIHGAGSYSTVPPTHPWGPPLFFALSGLGALVQNLLMSGLKLPDNIIIRRTCNLASTIFWLWITNWALVDDLGRCGIWLFEPIPVSFARAAGLGSGLDRRIWRWDRDSLPRWHWGANGRWWETGVAI